MGSAILAKKIEQACYKIRLHMRLKRRQFNDSNTAYGYHEIMPYAGPVCEEYGISCGHVLTILGVTIPKKNSKNRRK